MTDTTIAQRAKSHWLVPIAALFFVFSGFYKGLVDAPIDLTVFTAALTCIAIIPHFREIDIQRHAAFWLLTALTLYLAGRLLPDPTQWGIRKLAETVLFGFPALLAGYIIAKHDDTKQILIAVLAYSAPPMTILMLGYAVSDPYMFQWIGSSGYQMTGLFLGLSAIAAAASNRHICFAFAVLGVSIAGSLSAAVFAPISVLMIWMTSTRRQIVKQLSAALILVATYTVLVAPPLILMRALWKFGAVENAIVLGDKAPVHGGSALTAPLLKMMPARSNEVPVNNIATSDRLDIYKSAIAKIAEAPLFGHGYGKPEYVSNKYPHNIFLEMLAEGGVVAGFMLLLTLAAARPPLDDDAGAFVASCLVLLIGGAMFGGYWGNRILLLFIGIAMGLRSNRFSCM